MPKGFQGAKQTGKFSGGGFEKRPPGINYFSMKGGQTATVRILTSHDDIEWMPKWKTAPSASHKYGELINKIDVFEDGTPDPGYKHQLSNGWKCYIYLIWRQAPVFKRDPAGKLVKDAMDNKQIIAYADQIAVWETSYTNYEMLAEKETKFRSINAFDWEIKRIGDDKKTYYTIEPADPMTLSEPHPLTADDQRLIQTQPINITEIFCKRPNYEELDAYLSGNPIPTAADQAAPAPTLQQQAEDNTNLAAGPNPFLI